MTTFYFPLDRVVRHAVQNVRTPFFNDFFQAMTFLGNTYTVAFLVAAAAIFFLVFRRRVFGRAYALAIALSPLLGEVLVAALKYGINRKRPPLLYALVLERSPSLPSGHSFAAWSFYAVLAFLIVRHVSSRFWQICVWIFTGVLIALIGFSRIYLGVHWLSDVLASYALGAAWLCGVIFFVKRYAPISSRK